MPYIKTDDGRREALRNGEPALIAGELNYQIFYFIKHNYNLYEMDNDFIRFKIKVFIGQFLGEKPNYQKWNDMTGVMIRCYREIKRRLGFKPIFLLEIMDEYDITIDKYEDLKCKENGDVE